MKSTIERLPGAPLPLGGSLTAQGINFSIFSRHAHNVALVVSLPEDFEELIVFPLDPVLNKTGDIWHILLRNAPPTLRYGYRVLGPHDPTGSGHFFDGNRILLDPYARAIHALPWGEARSFLGLQPSCLLDDQPYDWEGDRPLNRPMQDSIFYELHVRGFTQHASSGVQYPGTFRGLVEKIEYLRQLGVTAVELLPVTEFDEHDCPFINPMTREPLKNYWGYNPLSFFAPKGAYASNPAQPLKEFRDMVKALHRAGIEVILDIVYNHTGEGGGNGKTTSFRGIDNTIYYLLDPWTKAYLNFSGCGNTCHCNHPVMRNLIVDALRWWVIDMHVDGFRFDLASILSRDSQGQALGNAPIVEMLAEDPVLANSKMIAEAWDAGGLYQVGSFSSHHRWAEWNGRFRDDIRSFFCGHPGKTAALAARLSGSPDLYCAQGRSPVNSVNFITSHDGFTLLDLVSYMNKHNLANGEENRDGDNNNISWNSGLEGPTNNKQITVLRQRRARSLTVALLLSHGVPMLVAGDEFGRSQLGNNNAWCQDNPTSWIDWSLAEKNHDMLRCMTGLIRLRKEQPIFRRHTFCPLTASGAFPPASAEMEWFGTQSRQPDWSQESHALALLLRGDKAPLSEGDDFFIAVNGSANTPAIFTAPSLSRPKRQWVCRVDTAAAPPLDYAEIDAAARLRSSQSFTVLPMACVVLQSITIRS